MLLQEVLDIYALIDHPGSVASSVKKLFKGYDVYFTITPVTGNQGSTEFVKIFISGKKGKTAGGNKPTLGIVGRLGGIGARPEIIGLVSDGDGAVVALSVALKLARMRKNGDGFDEDIIIATHLCTNAPTEPHEPVAFMGSPVDIQTMNKYEVDPRMDAIVSIDTSRGNKIINTIGFAITATVKEGWILRVSDDLLRIMETVTGKLPAVVPITMQDITPYDNNVYHFNSIMQPAVATKAPVVGVALTGEVPVPGCATGVSNAFQLDETGRFVIEVAQSFSQTGLPIFYDPAEYKIITKQYGRMTALQKLPK